LNQKALSDNKTPNLKHQNTNKSQNSISKTFPSIALHRFVNIGHLVMLPLGIAIIGPFVWNFEFDDWKLFEFCILVLGIFMYFIKQVYFEISLHYLLK
jgi:hypothetical protein